MSDREPKLETLIESIVEQRLAYLHTCMPAKVVSFDGAENKVAVQPLIKRSYIDDDGEDVSQSFPQIDDVPVLFPRGGGGAFSIVFPLAAGDIVTLVFAERSLDKWLSAAVATTEIDPVDLRKHQLSDAVAIPGGYPFAVAQTPLEADRVAIRYGGTEVHVADGKIELGQKDSPEKVAIDQKIQDNLAEISTQLNQLVNDFNMHTHPLPDMLYPLLPLPGPPLPTIPGVTPSPPTMKPVVPSSVSYSETPTESSLVTIKE